MDARRTAPYVWRAANPGSRGAFELRGSGKNRSQAFLRGANQFTIDFMTVTLR
jgi:hypothetical protein